LLSQTISTEFRDQAEKLTFSSDAPTKPDQEQLATFAHEYNLAAAKELSPEQLEMNPTSHFQYQGRADQANPSEQFAIPLNQSWRSQERRVSPPSIPQSENIDRQRF
jgi:hypothetical protein